MSATTTDFTSDIPYETARAAHYGTSFVPERRAEQERDGYAETLRADLESLTALADTDDKRATLEAEFTRYRAGYRKRYLARLHSDARVMSSMITGPANFPVDRNRKRCDVAHKRLVELIEFRTRALAAIRRALCPEDAPIMSGDADAVQRLRERVAEAEAAHTQMRDNPALRKSGLSLSNSSANIRRLRQRLASISAAQTRPDATSQGLAARLEDCPAENRVRLFFPGKPDSATRLRLKANGFRWAPSLGCWQAYRNPKTLRIAPEIAGVSSAPHAVTGPTCGCPVNAPEADAGKWPCPCGSHCQHAQCGA